jgi:hypothetical protein
MKLNQMNKRLMVIPAILEPDFDLLGVDVGENGALPDQLLPAQRAGLGALGIDPLERLDLFGRVPYILPRIKVPADAPTAALSVLLSHHRHFLSRPNQEKTCLKADFLVGFGFRSSRLKILWLSKVRLGLGWEHLCCLLTKVKAKMLKRLYMYNTDTDEVCIFIKKPSAIGW